MNKIYIIYAHKCKTTQKYYVGQTCRKLETRWGKNGTGYTQRHNLKFYNAIQKYGWEDFEHIVLAKCNSLEDAYNLESYYIDMLDSFKNGYNSTVGGAGSKGKIIGEETRKRLSENHKGKGGWKTYKLKSPMLGKHHSEETKRKIGDANRGRVISQEGRNKMSKAKMGKKRGPQSEETRRKNSLAHLGKTCPNKGKHINHPHNVKVIQFDKKGNILGEYDSLRLAAERTGLKPDSIGQSIKRGGTCGGYIWKRKN